MVCPQFSLSHIFFMCELYKWDRILLRALWLMPFILLTYLKTFKLQMNLGFVYVETEWGLMKASPCSQKHDEFWVLYFLCKKLLSNIKARACWWWFLRFIYGKPDVPKASPEIAAEVQSELADLQRDWDWDAAVQLVVKAGDPSAESLAANDWYRLRRRLEIIRVSFLCSHIINSLTPSLFQFLHASM